MSEIKNYGKVVMTFEEDWDSSKLYDRLCVVRYKNLTYISKKDNLIGTAPSNSEDWELLSTPGVKGDQGPKGDRGEQGLPAVSYKNVTIFSTYNPTIEKPYPNKPKGGYWDVSSDIIIFPEGWTNEDNIAAPVWMSVGTFSSLNPDNPVWTIPQRISGEKGNNGVDGVSQEFIYARTKTDKILPPTITNSNTDDWVPEGWSDSPKGISEELQVEWCAVRKKDSTGNWLDFDNPFIWSKWGVNGLDGDGVQYIFRLNKGESISNPIDEFDIDINSDQYQEIGEFKGSEFIPGDGEWTDNPQGVDPTNTHEWCCKRKFKNGKWGTYSNPALWAKYSEDGTNGINGISVITRYAVTDNSSEIPNFEKENNNPGSEWGSIIPFYESPQALWEIQAYVDYKGNLVEITNDDESVTYGWQGPVLKSGVAGEKGVVPNYKSTYFCKADSVPNKPTYKTLSEVESSSIWLDYPNDSGQWWQSTALIDGNTEEIISWGNVLQVNGQDGIAQDGKYWETRFAASPDDSSPELDKYSRDPSNDNANWIKIDDETPPPTIPEGGSLWQTWAEIEPGGTTLVNGWSDPYRINGERGPRGYTGSTGEPGAQGPSGIPGVSFEVIYCLGTDTEYLGNNPQTDGTFDNFWNLVVPEVNEEYKYIWCSQGKKIYSNNEGDYSIEWGKPFRLSGINGIGEQGVGVTKIENYYAISNNSTNPPADEDWEEEGIIPELNKDYPYLWNYEIVKYSNGTEQKTTPQVISLVGEDGRNIKQIIEYYYVGPEAEGVTIDSVEWKTEPLYPDDVNIYLWNREEIIFDKGESIELDPIRIGNYSKGEAGPIGKTIYPAGIYNSETTYTCNETSCPYVLDTLDGNYYLLNADKWESGQTISPSQSFLTNPYKYWSKMDFYEAIFAKVGVIANGLFGSAVFNGNYMFSQQGVDKDNVVSTNYELFGKDINGNSAFDTSGNLDLTRSDLAFYPNILINFKTGLMYAKVIQAGQQWMRFLFNEDSIQFYANDNGDGSLLYIFNQEGIAILNGLSLEAFIGYEKLNFFDGAINVLRNGYLNYFNRLIMDSDGSGKFTGGDITNLFLFEWFSHNRFRLGNITQELTYLEFYFGNYKIKITSDGIYFYYDNGELLTLTDTININKQTININDYIEIGQSSIEKIPLYKTINKTLTSQNTSINIIPLKYKEIHYIITKSDSIDTPILNLYTSANSVDEVEYPDGLYNKIYFHNNTDGNIIVDRDTVSAGHTKHIILQQTSEGYEVYTQYFS